MSLLLLFQPAPNGPAPDNDSLLWGSRRRRDREEHEERERTEEMSVMRAIAEWVTNGRA